jgi:hypothetical protein
MTPFSILIERIPTVFAEHISVFTARRAATYAFLICALLANAPGARAQGSRKDDIAFGATGRPIAGAIITVCSNGATGTPCSPLATLYTDATLTTPTSNPFQSDGLGNYHFYATPGRYVVQVSGSGINTYTINDTILPNDPSTPAFNSVTATSITLGGNLSVGGNANVTGTFSAGTFAPSSISTSSLQVTGSASIKGPRPWNDVMAYGADPTGSADSTSAIQSAINAACVSPGGTVYFPSGAFKVIQPQTPSTSPVFAIPSTCLGLTIQGGSSSQSMSLQFSRPPLASISVAAGSSPNMYPVFLLSRAGSASATAFRDIEINGYNQAVQLYNTSNINFDNVCLSAANSGNGTRTGGTDNTDNAPLAVYNTFWVNFRGGCILNQAGSATTPLAVFAFLGGGLQPNLGLFEFRDIIGSGGGFIWDCRSTSGCTDGGGNVFFDNIFIENATMPFYTVNNTAGGAVGGVPVTFNNSALGDCSIAHQPFMYYNGGANAGNTGGADGGTYFNNVSPCPGGQYLTVASGRIYDFTGIGSGSGIGQSWPIDSNGNARGDGMARLQQGTLFFNDGSALGGGPCGATPDLSSGLTPPLSPCSQTPGLPPIAVSKSGNSFASLGLSPTYGQLFGSGSTFSYESAINRNSANTLDIEFAAALAPTGLTATATTGGTLANGTYYYSIQSYSAGAGNPKSAGSTEVSVALSGSNNATSLSWDAPAGSNPGGCYIFRATTVGGTFGSTQLLTTISNCTSTTTYTDTGGTLTSGGDTMYNSTLATYYHFAPSSANPSGGTVPYFSGSPSGCAAWSTGGLLSGTGAGCGAGTAQTAFVPSPNNAGNQAAPSATNTINVVAFWIPFAVTVSHLTVDIGTSDSTGGDLYDVGIYNISGAVQCSWGATAFSSTGMTDKSCKQGSVTLASGYYVFALTGNATTAKVFFGSGAGMQLLASATSGTSSSGGVLPNSISVPAFGGGPPNLDSTYSNVYIALTQN